MSALAAAAEQYLRLRNSLGHDLAEHHRLLPRFVAYLDATDTPTITVAAALAWAYAPGVDPASSNPARRMTIARGFARHMAGIDPDTEVPPPGLIAGHRRWRPPFIYSPADIDALLARCRGLHHQLPAATHETLFGLLAVTGMRIGEAIRLDRRDIDWAAAGVDDPRVEVRQVTHGSGARIHPRTLDRYAHTRDRLCPQPLGLDVLRLDDGHSPDLRVHRAGLPSSLRQRGNRRRRRPTAADPRSAPHLRRPHPARVVSGRGRRRGPAADPVDLPRPSRPALDLLVPVSGTGTVGAGRPPARAVREAASR